MHPPIVPLLTERLELRYPGADAAAGVLAYRVRNRAHLGPWEPAAADTLHAVAERLGAMRRQMQAETARHWLIHLRGGAQVIGECSLTNIVRGPFQACHLGFAIDGGHQGHGYMREVLAATIAHAFEQLGLHRVMANYQPHNRRSARLLAGLGFETEGLAKQYLKIDGQWRDHLLTSLINPVDRDGH